MKTSRTAILVFVLIVGAVCVACAAMPAKSKAKDTRTYVDPGRRFAFDYPAACSVSAASRIEIEDPNGPTLFVDAEELTLAQAARSDSAESLLTQHMHEWINTNHFADGPEGSVNADGIRVGRRFKTAYGLTAYEWKFDLVAENVAEATSEGSSDSMSVPASDTASVNRQPAAPVYAVEYRRADRTVVIWVGARDWTVGDADASTMLSVVSSLRRP